ncbi:sensor histidine kinase [Arenimonas sp.]|jgi:two-component system sensor histidine kinase PilS (NtrC family)|uniref:sensor histidine kinase n=1 Tax=Arenimonas sp. TaxID=1872635 RepID=UPI0037BF614E
MAPAFARATDGLLRQRELYYFALFRCLEAALLALWVFSPYAPTPNPVNLETLQVLSGAYLVSAALLLVWDRLGTEPGQLIAGLSVDMAVFAVLAWLLQSEFQRVALMMLVNMAAAGLLLSQRRSSALTVMAIALLFAHYLMVRLRSEANADVVQTLMLAASYAATVLFCQLLANQAKLSQALAETRGLQLAEMAQMNEQIIKCMRSGVILLDRHHRVLLSNEAAGQLSRQSVQHGQRLWEFSEELDNRLELWCKHPEQRPEALSLYEGGPTVIPRFVSIALNELNYLVFLEDSRIFSGRADELQLANLGRLSASIAHEIRNPLAAISYAQQLLAESETTNESDRRMLEIIGNQSKRLNGIIENILGLARRQTANPQILEINGFLANLVAEHLSTHPDDRALIHLQSIPEPVHALFDQLHLHQIMTVLLTNALEYGHVPHIATEIRISVRMDGRTPVIDISDRGPGIALKEREQLFMPFYTTSHHGAGLGLYIAKQLADANQAQLCYETIPGGGSRFSLHLCDGQTLLDDHR